MKILGIETSCDETAAAVVEDGIKVLSSVIATSAEMHAKTGGIIPEQAARQQVKSIIPVIKKALKEAFPKSPNRESRIANLDALSVTVGPGLIGSLLVGVETVKTLSLLWNKPIVPINHLVAHLYANWLSSNPKLPQFPALALVVSGGHTDIVLTRGHGKLKWVGGTKDDAAGEAFDKTARLLGLPYPGGPVIAAKAEKHFSQASSPTHQSLNLFPRPLIDEDSLDLSFSGLKTAVLRKVKKQSGYREKEKTSVPQLAAEIQEAIVDLLVKKSIKAIKKYQPKSFLLAGGVAANKRLRNKLSLRIKDEKLQVIFHVPHPRWCTDNAAVTASCSYYNYRPVSWEKIKANPQLMIAKKAS